MDGLQHINQGVIDIQCVYASGTPAHRITMQNTTAKWMITTTEDTSLELKQSFLCTEHLRELREVYNKTTESDLMYNITKPQTKHPFH